jgi:hypothetical protein
MTPSIQTLSIMGIFETRSINDIEYNVLSVTMLCRYAICRNYVNVMLSVVSLNVLTLSVVAPFRINATHIAYLHKMV